MWIAQFNKENSTHSLITSVSIRRLPGDGEHIFQRIKVSMRILWTMNESKKEENFHDLEKC